MGVPGLLLFMAAIVSCLTCALRAAADLGDPGGCRNGGARSRRLFLGLNRHARGRLSLSSDMYSKLLWGNARRLGPRDARDRPPRRPTVKTLAPAVQEVLAERASGSPCPFISDLVCDAVERAHLDSVHGMKVLVSGGGRIHRFHISFKRYSKMDTRWRILDNFATGRRENLLHLGSSFDPRRGRHQSYERVHNARAGMRSGTAPGGDAVGNRDPSKTP